MRRSVDNQGSSEMQPESACPRRLSSRPVVPTLQAPNQIAAERCKLVLRIFENCRQAPSHLSWVLRQNNPANRLGIVRIVLLRLHVYGLTNKRRHPSDRVAQAAEYPRAIMRAATCLNADQAIKHDGVSEKKRGTSPRLSFRRSTGRPRLVHCMYLKNLLRDIQPNRCCRPHGLPSSWRAYQLTAPRRRGHLIRSPH